MLYLSQSTSLCGVSTAMPCRCAPGCWVTVGCAYRGTAGGVYGRLSNVGFRGKGCSRSPPRGRRLPADCWQTCRACPHPAMRVGGKVSSWTRRRNRRVADQAVFAVVTGVLRVSPTGRNISIDALATHLIINRRLPHGRHRRGSSARPASTWCVRAVDRYGDKDSERAGLITSSDVPAWTGHDNQFRSLL